jgi:hypothetical protein
MHLRTQQYYTRFRVQPRQLKTRGYKIILSFMFLFFNYNVIFCQGIILSLKRLGSSKNRF